MYAVSSEKPELARLEDNRGGVFAVSEAQLESWKISRWRVDAIDNDDEPCLQYQDLISDDSRRVKSDW